jgi:hypothetical protein
MTAAHHRSTRQRDSWACTISGSQTVQRTAAPCPTLFRVVSYGLVPCACALRRVHLEIPCAMYGFPKPPMGWRANIEANAAFRALWACGITEGARCRCPQTLRRRPRTLSSPICGPPQGPQRNKQGMSLPELATVRPVEAYGVPVYVMSDLEMDVRGAIKERHGPCASAVYCVYAVSDPTLSVSFFRLSFPQTLGSFSLSSSVSCLCTFPLLNSIEARWRLPRSQPVRRVTKPTQLPAPTQHCKKMHRQSRKCR